MRKIGVRTLVRRFAFGWDPASIPSRTENETAEGMSPNGALMCLEPALGTTPEPRREAGTRWSLN